MSTIAGSTVSVEQPGRHAAPRFGRRLSASARNQRWRATRQIAADVLVIAAVAFVVYWFRFFGLLLPFMAGKSLEAAPGGTAYLAFLFVYEALFVLAASSQKLYEQKTAWLSSWTTELILLARSTAISAITLTGFIYLSGIKTVSRIVVGATALCTLAILSCYRLARSRILARKLAKGIDLRNALIVGAGETGVMLAEYLQQNPAIGYDVRGFLDFDDYDDPRIVGTPDELPRAARQLFIDDLFITAPSDSTVVKQMVFRAKELNLAVKFVPELSDGFSFTCPLDFVGDIPVRVLQHEPIPPFGLFLKRITDVVGSVILLSLLSPLAAVVALLVAIESPGQIFYRGYRMGKKTRKFICYKFRTMVQNADLMKNDLKHLNERKGAFFKISEDPRLTRLGRILRKYSIDEIPQLWNVLRGEMSLVGPRPPCPDEVETYSLEHLGRLEVTPGITGLWQIEARHDPSFDRAVALDRQYIECWSYMLDLKILLRTVSVVLKGTGK